MGLLQNAPLCPYFIKKILFLNSPRWQRQDTAGSWTAANEGTVRGGALILPNARTHHASRYACSSGPETSPRLLIRLVVLDPLTVSVSPSPLVSQHFQYLLQMFLKADGVNLALKLSIF